MLGRFDEAWPLAREAAERLRELRATSTANSDWRQIATLAGDHEAAARYLRRCVRHARDARPARAISRLAPKLGRSLCALGRYDEAEPLAQLGRELGDEQDVLTQMLWRQVQALVHAHRGEHARGRELAREAVTISERTDCAQLAGRRALRPRRGARRRRPHRRGSRRPRAGARALRAQEEPGHGRAGQAEAGGAAPAVGYLTPLCEFLRERDERFQLSSIGSMLGRQLRALHRYDEAERWSRIARGLEIRESVLGEALWRQVQALVHASLGEDETAGELAYAAVALIDESHGLSHQGDALCDLSEVLAAAGRRRRGRDCARAGAQTVRAQEKLGHGRAGAAEAGGAAPKMAT